MSCDWLNKVVELLIEYKQPIGTLFVSGESTLFGVWLSNLSRKGQIKIYLNNEECCRCSKTTATGKQEAVFLDADIAIYRFSLDVYNSRSDNKIIRDIFVLLCDKKKILEEIFHPEVDFTQTEVEEKCSYCDFKAFCRN